ncbi:dienelactone hydrolase family protein [Methylobacterium oryzisoli]|uniref:dienelactone hydrolase family protein n=1 Tax=Methylobacterium oryzisoli TaxID=3385502 RepID=UPI003892C753
MGTVITFGRLDGGDATGYLASTARGDAPGLVVIQEWWGVSEQIKGLCDRFASAGFTALAPDLYGGTVIPYHDAVAAAKEMQNLDFKTTTAQVVGGAVAYLARNGAAVGLTGFCMGGAITIIGAAIIPGLSACVAFYGLPPADVVDAATIAVPLQGHFANRDDWCTPQAVDTFEARLHAAGKPYEFFRYEADHAFANEQRASVHDRAAAELAWTRAVAFLCRHLLPR